jgi:hypothetical protein
MGTTRRYTIQDTNQNGWQQRVSLPDRDDLFNNIVLARDESFGDTPQSARKQRNTEKDLPSRKKSKHVHCDTQSAAKEQLIPNANLHMNPASFENTSAVHEDSAPRAVIWKQNEKSKSSCNSDKSQYRRRCRVEQYASGIPTTSCRHIIRTWVPARISRVYGRTTFESKM